MIVNPCKQTVCDRCGGMFALSSMITVPRGGYKLDNHFCSTECYEKYVDI
jgi:hypothetical protein